MTATDPPAVVPSRAGAAGPQVPSTPAPAPAPAPGAALAGARVPALSRTTRALAVVSGVAGLLAGVALVGFFALSDPWRTGGYGPWAWLGPADDVLGAVFALALVPATLELARAFGRDRLARWWSVATALGLLALAGASYLLLTGRVGLDAQFAASGVAMPVLVGWILLVSRRGERQGLVGWATARLGTTSVALVGIGVVLALPALVLLPLGSPGQVVLLVPGVVAWVALSTWPAVLGTASSRAAPPRVRRVVDAVVRRGYRLSGGRLPGRVHGAPVLLLTTTGRRSGDPRTVPLAHVRDGAAFLVVAAGGPAGPPAWYLDVVADPDVRVEVGLDVLVARATALTGTDAGRALDLLASAAPRLERSSRTTPSGAPLVRLEPV